jgi:glycosidase
VSTARDPWTVRRSRVLRQLYGAAAAHDIGERLDSLLATWSAERELQDAARRRPWPAADQVIDEGSAWVIAYADHLGADGELPLATLDRFVTTQLVPHISGVHTLPMHPASGDGGFSVIDHALVDPAFGDWGDLERLAGHVTWVADAVVNHLSSQSTWFRAFLAGDPRFVDHFARLAEGIDTTAVVRPRTSPLAHAYTTATGGRELVWTTFSDDQVDLDFANPDVLLAIVEVLLRYVQHGAQAIRLYAIAFVWKDPATASVHLPQTHAIVQLFRACLDQVAPFVMLITETNVPHAENVSYFGPGGPAASEADAVYQFALPPMVLHAALSGTTGPLRAWLAALQPPPPERLFLNFLASHDGIGLRPAEGLLDTASLQLMVAATHAAGGVVNQRTVLGADRPYELAVSWFALMGLGVDEATAVRKHLATHAVALAMQGVPLLYLNSLFGIGNDTNAYARTGHGRDLNRTRLRTAALEADLCRATTVAAQVWTGLRAMLDARRSSPAFHPSAALVTHDCPDGTMMVERFGMAGQRALVVVNLTNQPHTVHPPRGPWVLTLRSPADAPMASPGSDGPLRVAPWQSLWFVTDS